MAYKKMVGKSASWQSPVSTWLAKRGAGNLNDAILTFFEKSFHPVVQLYPEQAWFGVHANCVSMTIGNIWLAAIASPPKAAYLLVPEADRIKGFGSLEARSTTRYVPLEFLMVKPWDSIGALNRQPRVWDSYARACELILRAPISRNVIARNLHRKTRLTALLDL